MVGETTINYAASKMQPSAAAPLPPEMKVVKPNPVTETNIAPREAEEAEATPKATAKKPAAPKAKKAAAKKPARGRGRPAGSKNKKKKKSTATKAKTTAPKAAPKAAFRAETKSATKEPFTQGNDMMKAAMDSGNITAEIAKSFTDEMVKFANKNFSENVELSKEFFSCRTMSDMFEIQNKIMKQNLDSFFKQSSKMSEMMFKAASKTGAPINGSLTQAVDEWKKKFAA